MFKDMELQGFYREGTVIFNDNKNTDFSFLEDIIVINNDNLYSIIIKWIVTR